MTWDLANEEIQCESRAAGPPSKASKGFNRPWLYMSECLIKKHVETLN